MKFSNANANAVRAIPNNGGWWGVGAILYDFNPSASSFCQNKQFIKKKKKNFCFIDYAVVFGIAYLHWFKK